MQRALQRILFIGVLLAMIGACTDDGEGKRAEVATSPTGLPAIVDGAACPQAPPELELPSDSGCATSMLGNFEPDSLRQTLVVYALLDDERRPSEWHLRLTRPSGSPLDERVDIGSEASYPLALGAEDADGDELDEAFVKLVTHSYHSGKTHDVGIFGVRDSHFFQVQADGEPLLFQVGGVSVFGMGAECRDVDANGTPEFLLLHVDGVTNDVQKTIERTYTWRNRSLLLKDRKEGRMAKAGYSDPLLWRYYSLRCFEFEPEYPFSRN